MRSVLSPRVFISMASLGLALQYGHAHAYETSLRPQFERLEPDTRLEEVCDTEVALRLNREQRGLAVDKVVSYTFRQVIQEKNNKIVANGAAFRSRGKWFHLKFECQTGPKHMDVHMLTYTAGAEIPRSQWARHYLYD